MYYVYTIHNIIRVYTNVSQIKKKYDYYRYNTGRIILLTGILNT